MGFRHMTFHKYLTALAIISLPFYSFAAEDNVKAADEIVCEDTDDLGWGIISTDKYTVNFPSQPKIDKKGNVTSYSSLDASGFPVVMYLLTAKESKAEIDAQQEVDSYLEKVSTYPSNLLHQQIAESDDEIIVDTLCSDAKTRVFRCERLIIVKNATYTLTTLFFANSAENHEYYVGHFVRQK